MQGAEIGSHCTLSGCIVAGGVRIGDHCTIDGMSVLGEGVTLGDGNVVSNGARIFPGVELPDGAILLLMGASLDSRRCRRGRLDRPGRGDPRPVDAPARRAVARRLGRRSRPSTRPAG